MSEPRTTGGAERIDVAHEIATLLWDRGMRGPDGAVTLAMALGLYLVAQEGADREFRPVVEGMLIAAQQTFDAFQEVGHA